MEALTAARRQASPFFMPNKQKILLALSGGVDSAVAALLLQRRGFEVLGAFIKMWSPEGPSEGECDWRQERRDAYAVGAKLKIPVITLDFETDYRREVLADFIRGYERGETPNPDILCNSRVKFPLLREEARRRGIKLIATGHYARLTADQGGNYHLLRARDAEKDQTYFLSGLLQTDLGQTFFPVGEYQKREVRGMARRAGLTVWDKRSTRGICFVGKVDLPAFLGRRIADRPGPVVDNHGRVCGRHTGVHTVTIGQRHGLGAGGGAASYVLEKRPASRTVVITADERELYSRRAQLREVNWIAGCPARGRKLRARARYRAPLVSVRLVGNEVLFASPVRALTPGQELVFYSGQECLGGGPIAAAGARGRQ